jgi:predicted nucleic acid-binding protein
LLSSVPVSVDTCTLINILASGVARRLFSHLSGECIISEAVSRESLFLRSRTSGSPAESIDLSPLLSEGILKVCQADTPQEEALYVQLASDLDDGEALSLAISVTRGYGFATDDRKAARLAKSLGLVKIYTTPDIVSSCSDIDYREVLMAIEFRARFYPGADHPLYPWWMKEKGIVS